LKDEQDLGAVPNAATKRTYEDGGQAINVRREEPFVGCTFDGGETGSTGRE